MKDVNSWHKVSASKIGMISEQEKTGFKFFYSPRDIPVAWRLTEELDEDNKLKKAIEFKYLSSPEHILKKAVGHYIQLDVGKRSGLIFRIVISIPEKPLSESFPHILDSAFQAVSRETKSREPLRTGNMKSITAIVKNEEELRNILADGEH